MRRHSFICQDVLMKRVSLPSVLAELKSTEAQHLAYEMAVCVCDADGAQRRDPQRRAGEFRKPPGGHCP